MFSMLKALFFTRQLVLFFTLALCAIGLQAQESLAPENKGFLWKISDSDSSVYLLGSVHFANADYYPMSRAIEAAFAEADTVAVEIDITSLDPLKTQLLMQEMGNYSDGRTLKDELSPETLQKLEAYLGQKGFPSHLFMGQKPGMLIMSLTSMELMNLGMLPQFGIDLHFLSRAKGNKHIVELETLEQQMELLLNMDDGDAALAQTLDEFPTFPVLSKQLFRAWQTGDTSIMQSLLIDEPLQKYPESQEYFDKLFTDRNLTMTDKIKGYLNDNKTYFVIVGAGHLIGEDGVVSLLGDKEFRVERR
jgi:uncharacterized protein